MVGTLINVATVLVGGAIGVGLGGKLPERIQKTVLGCLGLFTLLIGAQMTTELKGVAPSLSPKFSGALADLLAALVMLISLLLGALTGEGLKIQDQLDAIGEKLRRRFQHAAGERFTEGFVTTSLLFCVGPMTIMGSINDGLRGDFQLLTIKAIMDGFAAMAFAAELGIGVLFSAVTVLVVQGGLTLGAHAVDSWLTDAMRGEMTAVGGLLIVGIGLRLLEIKKLQIANFLPALVFAPLFIWVLEKF